MPRDFSSGRALEPREYFVYSKVTRRSTGGKAPAAVEVAHIELAPTKGQAIKGARGMPWHQEPMKDVTSCDKLRGAANELRSGDFRMGKPTGAILQ